MKLNSIGKTFGTTVSAAAIAALALAGCGSDNNTGTSGNTGGDTGTAAAGSAEECGGKDTLTAEGSSAQQNAMAVFAQTWGQVCQGKNISYNPTGSGAGREQFVAGNVDIGGSDSPIKDEQAQQATQRCNGNEVWNLPLVFGPVAMAYNVEGVEGLVLNADVIAQIFQGGITNWNDPAIAELNSGVTLPDLAITPVHRSDNSGTTENFTATLAQVAPSVWTDAASGDWPASLAGEAAQGTSGVIAAVQNGSGTIGYADESGVPDGMSMALYSQDGSAAYTGPEADAAGAIVEASSRVAGREDNDWALDLDRTAAGYPFVLVSYAIVCQQYSDASVGELVNAYISYIVSDEGQEAAVPQAGNAPLSGTLATGVQAAAASIK